MEDDDRLIDDYGGPSASSGPSPEGSGLRVNRVGLAVRRNSSAVALKELSLSEQVPPKKCWVDAEPLFGARLTWGQAYTFFTLITAGKDVPVERTRDEEDRVYIMYSACPYSISPEQVSAIEEADQHESPAYLQGMARSAQQKIRYSLYGLVNNHFNERVFTGSGVQPANELVKMHLGLVGEHAGKSFMDM